MRSTATLYFLHSQWRGMLDIHLWVSPVIHLSQYHISDLHNKRDITKGEHTSQAAFYNFFFSYDPATTAVALGMLEDAFLPLTPCSTSSSAGFGEQQFCHYLIQQLSDFGSLSHVLPRPSLLQLKCYTSVNASSSGCPTLLIILLSLPCASSSSPISSLKHQARTV